MEGPLESYGRVVKASLLFSVVVDYNVHGCARLVHPGEVESCKHVAVEHYLHHSHV